MKETPLFSFFRRPLACCMLLLCVAVVWAVPAQRKPEAVMQPDGSYVTLNLHGDEFSHLTTTADGYTVVKNVAGYYTYAVMAADGTLAASQYIAKDVENRTFEENNFLASIPTFLKEVSKQELTRALANGMNMKAAQKAISTQNFKGLIILAQFLDREFLDADPKSIYEKIVTEKNLKYEDYRGSVRDYFYENSMGAFDPKFDVVGPVTLSYKQADAGGHLNTTTPEMVAEACRLADDLVDYSNYDLDKDGLVDLVFVVFAGGGSNVPGNNQNYVWPHAFGLYPAVEADGVFCQRYACSTELCGQENVKKRDGIGTICHEFSHVLGLPDFYDTDYDGSGGIAPDPGVWSLMAGGSYLNDGRNPAGYSGYERYLVGWAKPQIIGGESGRLTLEPLQESNTFMWLNSTAKNEFFILENRQQSGWDEFLPGHGMLVYRVDRSSDNPWSLNYNTVNANPNHTYYELLCADNRPGKHTANTPFPGKLHNESLTDFTKPALLSWGGKPSNTALTFIEERDGSIRFNVNSDEIPNGQLHENFSSVNKTSWGVEIVEGDLGSWTFNKAAVKTLLDDSKVVALKDGAIEMKFDLPHGVKGMKIVAAAENKVKPLLIESSVDKGQKWAKYGERIDLKQTSFSPIYINKEINKPVRFRIRGARVDVALISSIVFFAGDSTTGIEQEKIEQPMKWSVNHRTLCVELEQKSEIRIFDVAGREVAHFQGVAGQNMWTAFQGGFYIVALDNMTFRVLIP